MSKLDRLIKMDRLKLGMIGGIVVVVGVILYFVVAQHGPALCGNALTCG
jgi:hypothetical protein